MLIMVSKMQEYKLRIAHLRDALAKDIILNKLSDSAKAAMLFHIKRLENLIALEKQNNKQRRYGEWY